MIKEEKNIDFYTTGRQLSEEEFVRISEWIKKDKEKKRLHNSATSGKRSVLCKKSITSNAANIKHQQ